MIVLAHRGLRSHGPENSLLGFEGVAAAASRGIPLGIEFDARMTADGKLIAVHDGTLKRPGYQDLSFQDVWVDEMRAALGNAAPPLLSEAIDIVRPSVPLVDIDIKERGYTKEVVDMAVEHLPVERLMISSHVPDVVAEVRKRAPSGVKVGMAINSYFPNNTDSMFELLALTSADFLFLHDAWITQEIIDRLHDAGNMLGAYTLNDHDRLHELIAMGVDFPCTDQPEMAIAELQHQTVNS